MPLSAVSSSVLVNCQMPRKVWNHLLCARLVTWQAGEEGSMQMEQGSEQPMTEGRVAPVASILQALLGALAANACSGG